jgi:hypothetical protein
MKKPVRILGIAGSLRRGSYNRAALRAAVQLVPPDATLDVFNQDEEQNPPAKVVELKRRLAGPPVCASTSCRPSHEPLALGKGPCCYGDRNQQEDPGGRG